MKNLTSELVEEFRKQFPIVHDPLCAARAKPSDKLCDCGANEDRAEIKAFMLTAFDRVRAEGRREAVKIIETADIPHKEHEGMLWLEAGGLAKALEAASGDIAS